MKDLNFIVNFISIQKQSKCRDCIAIKNKDKGESKEVDVEYFTLEALLFTEDENYGMQNQNLRRQ